LGRLRIMVNGLIMNKFSLRNYKVENSIVIDRSNRFGPFVVARIENHDFISYFLLKNAHITDYSCVQLWSLH
jgi:hypothetical protein